MPSPEAAHLIRIADALELIQPDHARIADATEEISTTLKLTLAAIIRVAAVEEVMSKCIQTGGKPGSLDRKQQAGLVNYVYTFPT